MDKKEEILMNENEEIIETKPSNKVKYAVAIVSTTLVLAAVTTLLIGHFKFDWFKSDNYKLDANISRTVYQANYFSEKKTVSTKFSFANGITHQKEYFLDTNFVVFLTDREELENKIGFYKQINLDENIQENIIDSLINLQKAHIILAMYLI